MIFHNANDFVTYFPIYNPEDPTTEIKRTKEVRLQTKGKPACLIPSLLLGLNMNQHPKSRVSNSTNVIYGKVHSTTGGQIYITLDKVGTK